MFPSLEEVKKYAAAGEYKRAPVAIEMLSDCLTTIEAVRILRNASHQCFLLESASQSEGKPDTRPEQTGQGQEKGQGAE